MTEMRERVESFNQSNDGYTTAGVIQLRLDTAPMLDQLEAFFRGHRITGYQQIEGGMAPIVSKIGTPKMNDAGVQSIMSWLTPLFSPTTVQGNFQTIEDLNKYLIRVELDLNDYVWTNRINWSISIEDVDGIIDMIINVAEPFFTRLLQNKERDSYGATMRHIESSRQEAGGRGILGMFK